jgi:hypothetical protein
MSSTPAAAGNSRPAARPDPLGPVGQDRQRPRRVDPQPRARGPQPAENPSQSAVDA